MNRHSTASRLEQNPSQVFTPDTQYRRCLSLKRYCYKKDFYNKPTHPHTLGRIILIIIRTFSPSMEGVFHGQ